MSALGDRINNIDLYQGFGVSILDGKDSFLSLPEIKEPFTKDWGGENGKQYDLSTLYFQDVVVKLKVLIQAGSKAEFWTNYYSFWAVLKSPGAKAFYIGEFEKNFSVFYRSLAITERFTKIKDTNNIGMEAELTLQNMSVLIDQNIPNYPDDFMLTKTVNSYAAMIAFGTPTVPTRFKVAVDESKDNAANQIYEKWPDGAIRFIPSSAGAYMQQFHVGTHAALVALATGAMDKIFFVSVDEVNPDDYGALGQPAIYMYTNGVLNKLSVRKDVL